MRQVVMDTETTGLDPRSGHRILEFGAVELLNRRLTGRSLHLYINPEREIDARALEVHGIGPEFLADKPVFAQVSAQILGFITDAELLIHNAPFDVGFLDAEFARLTPCPGRVEDFCRVTDTLMLARELHPGQRNGLDALCKRYGVDNASRELHGALLDSELLAEVYLAMTGGQTSLLLPTEDADPGTDADWVPRLGSGERRPLRVLDADAGELAAHAAWLARLRERGRCLWDDLGGGMSNSNEQGH